MLALNTLVLSREPLSIYLHHLLQDLPLLKVIKYPHERPLIARHHVNSISKRILLILS
jgi:hypothetical protein